MVDYAERSNEAGVLSVTKQTASVNSLRKDSFGKVSFQ